MLWFPSKLKSGRFWNNPNQIDHELQLWNMWSKMFANAIVSLLCNNCRNSCCCRCSPQWHHWKLPTPWSVISYIFSLYFMYFHVIPWRSSGHPIPWSKSPFSILLVVICQSTGTLTLFQLAHFVPIPAQVLPATGQRRLAVALEALFDLGRIDNHLKDLWNHQVAENPCLLEMPFERDLDQAPMTLIYRFLIVYL